MELHTQAQRAALLSFRAGTNRNRLLFRCWHRGTQESDIILGCFADIHITHLTEGQLEQLEHLLGSSDADLFEWILGDKAVPDEQDCEVLQLLRTFWAHPGVRRLAAFAGSL
jgi:antitoxin CptB